ncbi:hypothetical protein [Paenibacillus kobensis]|uniref:hypothetical protein n=1 Tax=Paenibacillus kobensis TaxID=59841 RepID=UPI000FD9817F|nr:hypothetical protein [Paenibacillus kobensis]
MMEQPNRGRANIVGNGSVGGGAYTSVRIVGEGEVLGALGCDTFTCTGNCTVFGPVRAGLFKQRGDVTVKGEWSGGHLKTLGQLTIEGSVRAAKLDIVGQLTAREFVETDNLKLQGAIEVNGLVNADQADIRLYGPSRVNEIGGGRIHVRLSRLTAMKEWLKPRHSTELSAALIEGDDIHLEHTRADIVRGNRIHIGAGCVIGRVEYSQSLHVARSAKIGEEVQL